MTKSKGHILIVDDDKRLCSLLEQYLSSQNYVTSTAKDTNEARIVLSQQNIDLIVLDVMMPDETGIEFTRDFKANNDIPILLLTAMGEVEDRIIGLESGADDYLTKPFEPRELSLRIDNLIKRKVNLQPATSPLIKFGDYIYNIDNGELHLKDRNDDIPLSSNEQSLMTALAKSANLAISREDLSAQLNSISERSIDVQIARLRKKIETDPSKPQYLRTARGKGYILKAKTIVN